MSEIEKFNKITELKKDMTVNLISLNNTLRDLQNLGAIVKSDLLYDHSKDGTSEYAIHYLAISLSTYI